MVEKVNIPVRDRVLANNYMAFAIGPLAELTRERLVEAVHAVALEGRQHRVGLLYGNDPKTLLWDERLLRQTAVEMVTEVPAMSQAELVEFCVQEANRKTKVPLRFVIAGDYIVEVVDHTLSDATETFQALKSVVQKMQDPAAKLDERKLVDNPTWTAFWHTFRLNRTKLREALGARKRTLYAGAVGTISKSVTRQDSLVLGVMSVEQAREVQKHVRATGGNLNSVLLAALMNRIHAAEIPLSSVRTTYNLRQYLPQGQVADGNFIAAQQVAGGSAKELAEQIELSNSTASPLLAATLGAVRNAMSRKHREGEAPVHDGRMQLTFSGLGVIRTLETLPWKSKDEHFYTGFTKPGPAGELTINAVKMKNKVYISGSYNAAVFEPALMQQVFDDVAAEPIRWAEHSS